MEESQSVRWVTPMKQTLFQKAGRELGAKGCHKHEGSGSGRGSDKGNGREATMGHYGKQCNIPTDQSAPRVDWVKGNHMRWGYHGRLGQSQKDL